jgi:hypothetical protein
VNPLLLDIFAKEFIHAHLHQAAQDALADQLPRPPSTRPDAVARQLLASGLRALAARLDPCLASEPSFVAASPR